MSFDFGGFQQKYKDQWERWYNKNVEGQAVGWANDPNVARNAYWKTSDFYKNYMKDLPGAQNKWYQANGWIQNPNNPGQWSYGANPGWGPNGIQQQQQQAAARKQQLLGGGKLANIADILRKQQSTPPAKPATPGMSGTAPVAPINYVQNDRLNQGKGWSKFKNQARGTDQFKMVNDIINQYFK